MNNNTQLNSSNKLDELYLRFASNPLLWSLDSDDFMQSLCKNIAEALQTERTAIYILESDNDTITLKNRYILSKNKHYSGFTFKKSEHGEYFKHLDSSRIIATSDVKSDTSLTDFTRDYTDAFNIHASLSCTIRHSGKLLGMVSVEHVNQKHEWSELEKRFLTSMSDLISQRVNALKLSEEEEDRYRSVFENSGDGMFLMKDNAFVDCNQALLELLNCSREQVLQKIPTDFTLEFQPNGISTLEMSNEKVTAALAGEKQNYELTLARFDGSLVPTELTLNRIRINSRTFILCTVRDITNRRKTEKEIAISREKIIEQNKGLSLINELSIQLQGSYTSDEIYEKTLDAIAKVLPQPRISIFTIDNDKQLLHFKSARRHKSEDIEKLTVMPINPDFHNSALETGKPINVPNIENDPLIFPNIKKALLEMGFKSMILVPLIVKNQRAAILYLVYDELEDIKENDQSVLISISKTVSLALDNAHTHAELAYLAHHDSLTGLGNRTYFHKQFLDKVNPDNYQAATLYLLDLDRFKEINDTLGHFTGDKLLQQIGPRLNTALHNRKFAISRLGGDEFIVLVYGIIDTSEASDIASNILSCLRMPFQIDDLNLEIDSSIGIAIYPKDGKDSHALLRSADVAMYQAKKSGLGFTLYKPDTDIHTPERLTMIAELGTSINSGQLFLHYQPKINLHNNEIIGFEALARWDHPRLGLLSPNVFVPLIEMSNSIFQLTEEVLHQALSQQMSWRKSGFNYTVAVNLSARNLIDDRIVNLLENLLKHYNTPANMLELEITETTLMQDIYSATDYLKQISNLGIQLSIDDFGTGYSSLAYINRFPVNKIKLDREFIMGMLSSGHGDTIVRTIINLAKTLDLVVIAEGVEDLDTLNRLRIMGCNQAQGYHICRPNTWDKIEKWIKQTN